MTDQDRHARALESLDSIDLDQFEDFESEDLGEDEAADDADAAARGRNAYVTSLWERYGYAPTGKTGVDRDAQIVTAHKMLQGFVNTFAPAGERYRVTFDPTISTAGTDMAGRTVAITPAPLFDETLTVERAVAILTGMATHEASHPRYGRATAQAVRRTFGNKRAPNTLSNVLDDVRIERRFAAEYPGYADVFRELIDYVGREGAASGDPPNMTDVVNLAICAIRFPQHNRWTPSTTEERDWWQAWAERWSREDAPRRHVEAIREGLRRIVYHQVRRQKAIEDANAHPELLAPDVRRVKETLDHLPPNARRAMRMSAEGKSGKTIAATLGITEDDARALLRGARRRMAGASL